ncbi:MAG: NADPH-dependent F420 reductase [Bellilinea sp.]
MMTDTATERYTIGIIGGTGKEGKGLAYRWAKAGHTVLIGSRQAEKAQAAASDVNLILGKQDAVAGVENEKAAIRADIVVLTVPFGVHVDMCEFLKPFVQGKIFIDVTVPLVPPKVARVQMPPEGSAAQQAQAILGDGVQVVSAFQNISYEHLIHDDEVACDVLVCGPKEAREKVIGLVKDAGLVGWSGGVIENSVVVEGLTSVLIGLNKQFGIQDAGIRITGLPRQ